MFVIPITSFLVTYILVPPVIWIGEKYKLKDIPNNRKLHKESIVRIGGLPIFIGFLLGLLATAFSGYFHNFSFENISSYGRILLITSSSIFFQE